MKKIDLIEPIRKTPDGLREALYRELESLQAGVSTVTRARAVGKLAEEIHKSIRLEIEGQSAIEKLEIAKLVVGDG
mgnify:CR=1 FL=1|tara:strand:+ start:4622 stop:4849 length:228 start_codon:yes stop_codon:yes gene_type:complete